jgi:hypothetical protein
VRPDRLVHGNIRLTDRPSDARSKIRFVLYRTNIYLGVAASASIAAKDSNEGPATSVTNDDS